MPSREKPSPADYLTLRFTESSGSGTGIEQATDRLSFQLRGRERRHSESLVGPDFDNGTPFDLLVLANGRKYHLYSYSQLSHAPSGAVLRDANEIIPSSSIFRDSRGSYASFADYFRYKLLLVSGGWWVDTDIVCLEPLAFSRSYVFSIEPDQTIGNAVIRVPPRSEIMSRACAECQRLGTVDVEWSAAGPALLGQLVEELGLTNAAEDSRVFYPIDWPDWAQVLTPAAEIDLLGSKTLHLWNAMWDRDERDKNATYADDCLYERLKRKYLAGETDSRTLDGPAGAGGGCGGRALQGLQRVTRVLGRNTRRS